MQASGSLYSGRCSPWMGVFQKVILLLRCFLHRERLLSSRGNQSYSGNNCIARPTKSLNTQYCNCGRSVHTCLI